MAKKSVLAKLIEAIRPRRVTAGNPFHKPAGPGGGQFTSKGGLSSGQATRWPDAFDKALYQKEYDGIKVAHPIVYGPSKLPPVKSGYVRLYHGTSKDRLESISQRGLLTGKEANAGERIGQVLASRKGRIFNEVDVAFDVPRKEANLGSNWASVSRSIKPSEIVGFIPHRHSSNNTEVAIAYMKWKDTHK